jgi:hypothetical protein
LRKESGILKPGGSDRLRILFSLKTRPLQAFLFNPNINKFSFQNLLPVLFAGLQLSIVMGA